MVSTTTIFKKRISELQDEISKHRQELGFLRKELRVLESALQKLPVQAPLSQVALSQQTQPTTIRSPWTGVPIVVQKTMTIGRAAKNVLRDYGEPMRVIDILDALRKAGHEEIKYPALNSTLLRLARKGKLSRPEKGFYAFENEII